MNFDLCDHWVIYGPLRSEKTVIAVDQIKTVLSCSYIDISFHVISEESIEPVLIHNNYGRQRVRVPVGQLSIFSNPSIIQ